MRIAIIDLGTNSVRFDLHEIGRGNRFQLLHREKLMVRLGEGVFASGRLEPVAVRRTLQALRRFKEISQDLRVDRIVAVGTSALREARDGERTLGLIQRRTGIQVRVISGEEEARLIALGVLTHVGAQASRFALVDIGGGSTEVSVCRGREIEVCGSFPLGTARLQQNFLPDAPPSLEQVEKLRQHIRDILKSKWPAPEVKSARWVIGSSGTARAMAKMCKSKKIKGRKERAIELSEIRKLIRKMSQLTPEQLLRLPGMEPKRLDMILGGTILLEEVMDWLGADRLQVTDYSLRDGLLAEALQLEHRHETSSLSLHVEDLMKFAKKFGAREEHLRRVMDLAEDLFHRCSRLHGLSAEWLVYLKAAVILRDVGQSVSFREHAKHTAYIIRHADLPGAERWEAHLISELCRWHEQDESSLPDLEIPEEHLTKKDFRALLALLRVVDAMDSGHRTRINLKGLQIAKNRVVKLQFSAKPAGDLEFMQIEKKKKLFEKVFQYELQAELV